MPKLNGYALFAKEQGRLVPAWRNKSFNELIGLASEKWAALGPEEKQLWKQRAKEPKYKRDCNGKGVASVEDPREQVLREERLQRTLVEARHSRLVRDFLLQEKPLAAPIVLVDVNFWKEHKMDKDILEPAEISALSFNFDSGVKASIKSFHRVFAPSVCGRTHTVKENANRQHRIDVWDAQEMLPMATIKDLEEFVDFVLRNGGDNVDKDPEEGEVVRVFYVDMDKDKMKCLDQWLRGSSLCLQYHSLSRFVADLINGAGANSSEEEMNAYFKLERSVVEEPLVCKQVHRAMDCPNECCSLARVKMRVFAAMEVVAHNYGLLDD